MTWANAAIPSRGSTRWIVLNSEHAVQRIPANPETETAVGHLGGLLGQCRGDFQMIDGFAALAPFTREPKAGSTLNVLGVTHVYKATAAETGGAFSLWEAVIPP